MSFTYGGTNTATLAGVTATLTQWPSVGGLAVQSEPVPGAGGRVFAGSSMERTAFVFDVIIHGATVSELAQRRDNFAAVVDPARGPRDLILETDPDWKWADVLLAQEIPWDRYTWRNDLGFRLRATVTFETQREAAAVETRPRVHAGNRTVSFTVDRGNTVCYPRIEFPSGGTRLINVTGMRPLTVAGSPSGHTAVLDWDTFEFYLANAAGDRVRSLVPFMDHYERPALFPGQQVTVTANADIALQVYLNARRS